MGKEKKRRFSFFQLMTFLLALAAFIMSSIALFVTYDNGRLLRDAQVIINEVQTSLKGRKSAFFYSETPVNDEDVKEQKKDIESMKNKIEATRFCLKEEDDYAEARGKIEGLKKDMEDFRKKWDGITEKKHQEINLEIKSLLLSLKKKSAESEAKLDILSKKLDTLVNREEEE